MGRVGGKVLADGIAQRQLPVLDEEQRRHGGELLRHRADREHGLGRDGDGVLEVGDAVALAEDRLTAFDDDEGGAGLAGREVASHDAVDGLGARRRGV